MYDYLLTLSGLRDYLGYNLAHLRKIGLCH